MGNKPDATWLATVCTPDEIGEIYTELVTGKTKAERIKVPADVKDKSAVLEYISKRRQNKRDREKRRRRREVTNYMIEQFADKKQNKQIQPNIDELFEAAGLTAPEFELFNLVFFDRMSFSSAGQELGLDGEAVADLYKEIWQKLYSLR